MDTRNHTEPLVTLQLERATITLLGTAHVSRASADTVQSLLDSGEFDAVAVELCPSRHQALTNPGLLAKMDLFEVLRQGRAPMVTASLALGAYQQRMAEQLGIQPGAEMRVAVDCARKHHLPVLLIDREVGITLRRIYRSVPWWQRLGLVGGLLGSVLSREKISEEEVERLKEGDILESTFAEFAEERQDLYRPLIDERDRYMAAKLRLAPAQHQRILAVVGAGHLRGIQRYLQPSETDDSPGAVIDELDTVPLPSRWPKFIPWVVVGLILSGFVVGFSRSSELGWQLVGDWVLINGGLCALGALLAAAHPLTTVSAFLAAPLTSLNPTIGAGMVTAGVEIYFRKPRVGDFSDLRRDTAHLKGWWRNRVTRVLLVFILSTLGSAVGTYVAGFRIFERLAL